MKDGGADEPTSNTPLFWRSHHSPLCPLVAHANEGPAHIPSLPEAGRGRGLSLLADFLTKGALGGVSKEAASSSTPSLVSSSPHL